MSRGILLLSEAGGKVLRASGSKGWYSASYSAQGSRTPEKGPVQVVRVQRLRNPALELQGEEQELGAEGRDGPRL